MLFRSFLKDNKATGDDVVRYADIISNSGEHLLSIINDIVDLSLIETGHLKITKSRFELNSLLIAIYDFFHSYLVSLRKFDLFLKLDIPQKDMFIFSDETRLRQILTNLISNAIKFTENGVIEFGYRADVNNINFFVKDTGIGISEDKKEIIFGRFQKVAKSKQKLYEGTGLGLAIAKACSNMLNGNIWFDSEENVGSTFYFNIRYEDAPDTITDSVSEEIIDFNFNNELVLIAEDDEYNFAFLEKLIKDHNLKLIRTATGSETIKKAMEHNDIGLILMDIKMPDLSGIDATIEIKRQKPEIPIIAQTAFAYDNDRREVLAAGCVDFITKPIDKKHLLSLIDMHILKRTGT